MFNYATILDPVTATPEEVILKLYDIGIDACTVKDTVQVQRVLNSLIDSLNFDYKEIATSFYNLYKYALVITNEQRFDEVRGILHELRSTWEQIMPATEGASRTL